jgi:hypothetical protein
VESLIDPGRVEAAGVVARWLWPILRPDIDLDLGLDLLLDLGLDRVADPRPGRGPRQHHEE